MAAQKFLTRVAGQPGYVEKAADQVGGSAASAGNVPALDANGLIPVAMMPTGVGPDTAVIAASEALAAGAFVNIYSLAGASKVRNADGSTTAKEAHGFVLAAVQSGANATIYFNGRNTQVTGMTPGPVWLSNTTPGAAMASDVATSGQTSQCLGEAISATEINFTRMPATALA